MNIFILIIFIVNTIVHIFKSLIKYCDYAVRKIFLVKEADGHLFHGIYFPNFSVISFCISLLVINQLF